MGVSRSTVYNWFGDIPIPGSGSGGGFSEEARRRGTRAMREGRRRHREWRYLYGLESYASLSTHPTFRDFLVSYVAVGKKSDPRELSFTHPDPLMMQIAVHWLHNYGRNRLRFRLQLPPGADPDLARGFWAERLGVSAEEIAIERSSASERPRDEASGKARPTRGNLLGTLKIVSTDTLLRIELQAWLDCARNEWRRAAEALHKETPRARP